MQGQLYPVRIYLGGEAKTYSPEFQTEPEFARAWKSVLKRAHGKAEVICLCPGRGAKRLAVKYISDLDIFYLSRFPESGHEHDPLCRYYGAETNSTAHSTDRDAVERLSDGTLRIKLKVGLQERVSTKTEKQTESETSYEPDERTKKPATALLRLLHILWIRSGLNRWSPEDDSRSIDLVAERLRKVAGRIMVGFVRLSEVLCLASSRRSLSEGDRNSEIVRSCIQQSRRLIVIAPLATYSEERENCESGCLPIYGFQGIPFLRINQDLWNRTRESFSRAVTAWRHRYRVVAVVQTETPTSEQWVNIIDVALVSVSKAWIPVDSVAEGRVEEKLRAEGRSFYKPLVYDDRDVILPDFVLTDTERNTPLEVFGMDEPDYEIRKQEKTRYYDRVYGRGGWWYWDVVANPDSIPGLPESKKKESTING